MGNIILLSMGGVFFVALFGAVGLALSQLSSGLGLAIVVGLMFGAGLVK